MKYLPAIFCILISVSSCYRVEINLEPDSDKFNLKVTPDMQRFIYDSRDTSYTVEEPDLSLTYNDHYVDLKEIKVRGNSALRFKRKSYAVFLSSPIMVTDRYGAGAKELSRFKLLALAMDYTYMEQRISFGLLQEAGVMPLFFKFVEFRINDETQGIYLLIEDPEQFYKENGSEFILRRGYNHTIVDSDYEPSLYFKPLEAYTVRYQDIYNSLKIYSGKDLYTELSARMDLDGYFRKLGIDFLLRNGDYTDELYLYAMVTQDTVRYLPIPWDYDDIFSENPHEVGRSWGMGTLFGTRYYGSLEDIISDVGHSLIFSIEDDMDYTIARDSFMYSKYIEVLSELFTSEYPDIISRVFSETSTELTTFYNSFSVIEQSAYDAQETTRSLWLENMTEKKNLLDERLHAIQQQIADY